MFKVLGKLPWFEWVGIISLLAVLVAGAVFFTKHGRMEEANKQLTKQTQDLSHLLLVEKRAAALTDQAVFDFTYERDLKVQEALGYRAQTVEDYFAARDSYTPTTEDTPKEQDHVPTPVKPKQPAPAKPKVVAVVDNPDPVAIAALVNGMQRTYCRAYHDRATCPSKSDADGVQAESAAQP